MKFCLYFIFIIFLINFNIVLFIWIAWIETYYSMSFNKILIDYLIQHQISCFKKFFCFFSNCLIIKYFRIPSIWIFTSNLPCLKEWVPINKRNKFFNIILFKNSFTNKWWFNNTYRFPIGPQSFRSCFCYRNKCFIFLLIIIFFSHIIILFLDFLFVFILIIWIK